MRRILFVCLGNICRSPLVEAVARASLAEAGLAVAVASCGTGDWHAGEGADPRMLAAAHAAGHDLSRHRARQLRERDFVEHDLLLAMDRANLRDLRQRAPAPELAAKAALFLEWSGAAPPVEFPDPWHGDEAGFAAAVALAERSVAALVERLRHASR
ncbi:low molecular weight protein-tyrosine-phosphatase [Rhodanobacter aciditrophus]|uniref:low molecular weight protein-tyrosine-phosphatase n=1 Tax=Rhodanobacter aciditrophus TaxID=1623218 RepID=UPI003CF326DD